MAKKIRMILGFLLCLQFIGLISFINRTNKMKPLEYNGIPTVFVHGYKGTFFSFSRMIRRFEKKHEIGSLALTIFVNEDGTLQKKHWISDSNQPLFIHVVFKNNRTSFSNTTMYLANALRHVKEAYRVRKVNLVGHSMGGIVSVKYAMEYRSAGYPDVQRLVTLGSPFAGILDKDYFIKHDDSGAKDLKPNSLALRKIHTSTFPKYIKVLNIGSTGDVSAITESVNELRNIVPKNQLTEVTIKDKNLSHSGLHEDERIDELIYRFLWQDEV